MADELKQAGEPDPLTIVVPGKALKSVGETGLVRSEDKVVQDHFGLVISAEHAVEVSTAARDAKDEARLAGIKPDALVEITYEDGSREWLRADALSERFSGSVRGPAEEQDVIHVPAVLSEDGTRAGLTGLVLKSLQILGFDPINAITDEISDNLTPKAARKFEDRLFTPGDLPDNASDAAKESNNNRGLGVHLLGANGGLGPVLNKPIKEAGKKPILVMLHGTFSTTLGSFGKLLSSNDWRTLHRFYEGRTFGLDHRTVSTGPAVNALKLIEKLPDRATLHLLSHSRGGLIGELLAHGPLTDGELASFAAHGEEERQALRAISAHLAAKDLTIERFVRVACPVAGTTLAGKRVDRTLSILLDLLELTPLLEDTLVYPFAKAMILSIIKEGKDPKTLPGLESMVPESAYTRLFNLAKADQTRTSQADLAVIAGDTEGEGLFSRISLRVADLFFGDDHDLVVNVRSMFQGVSRTEPVYYAYQQGPAIHHLNYFGNDNSRKHAIDWLTQQKDAETKPDGFRKLGAEKPIPIVTRESLQDQSMDDAPILVVVPTVLGTELLVDGQPIWPDQRALAEGKLGQLALDEQSGEPLCDVTTGYLIEAGYNDLLDALSHRFKVIPFPYDWRLSLLDAGTDLADAIDAAIRADDQRVAEHNKRLDAAQADRIYEAGQSGAKTDGERAKPRPVHILAHGTGGLVVRALMERRPNTWQRVLDREGCLLLLGMPAEESLVARQLLTGEARFVGMINLLDLGRDEKSVARIFRGFPGLLQLLPAAVRSGEDHWTYEWWRDKKLLVEANEQKGGEPREVYKHLGERLDAAKPISVELHRSRDLSPQERRQIRCVVSHTDLMAKEDLFESDETFDYGVENEAGFGNAPTWFINASTGAMLRRQNKYRAYVDLIKRGATDDLDRRVSARSRAPLRARTGSTSINFPDQADLADAALGRWHRRRPEKRTGTLRISVAHGSLEHASHPVAVGHYFGDVIVGSEAFLDSRLDKQLTRRFGLKLYPGQIGTADVLIAPEKNPPGGLVVGLGSVGELTPEILTDGVFKAALRYAMVLLESRVPAADQRGWISAAFSSVLIGTNGGRGLSVESSIVAIMQGVLLANRQLREQELWNKVRIDAVSVHRTL